MVVFEDEICKGQLRTNIYSDVVSLIIYITLVVGAITSCHLGERNSLTETPISAYASREVQKAHLNQAGREAAANKKKTFN